METSCQPLSCISTAFSGLSIQITEIGLAPNIVFSAVVPTFNRPGSLAACLGALGAQDYPSSEFEIIVVDDGGTCSLEGAAGVVPPGVALTLLRQSNSGPAAARNFGAMHARGARLAFTDDDCRPSPGWLSALAKSMDRCSGCAAGGRAVNSAVTSPFAEASQSILDAVYRHYNADPDQARFFATLNFAVPAAGFRELGGFDGSFRTSEDRDFCDRWLRDGRRMIYVPDAVVRHEDHRGFGGFWSQHYHYGRGAFRFRRGRIRSDGPGRRMEPGSFYWGLLAQPFRQAGPGPKSFLIAWLVVLSQLASGCGYLVESRRAPARAPRRSPVSGANTR